MVGTTQNEPTTSECGAAQRGLFDGGGKQDRGTDSFAEELPDGGAAGRVDRRTVDNEVRREAAREAEAEMRRTPATLRGYQLECLEAIADGHTRSDSVCVELPTGTGKTVIFTRYAAQQDYGRALVICPQLTLIRQAAAKIMEASFAMNASAALGWL